MKIGLCISNETPNLKGTITSLFQRKINQSKKDWSEKFSQVLDKKKIKYGYVYMDKDNWIKQADKYDILIWKPKFMGVQSSQFFKEKIYFIQYVMKKRIYPNYETVWHFDSKIAQKYFFEYNNITTPHTFVSFDYNEAVDIAEKINYPIVVKSSNGAGSTGVKLIKSKKDLMKKINYEFLGRKIIKKMLKINYDYFGYLYCQEFIKNNKGDLRITIIGDKYAVGFWRLNRDNDFRASGSGKINYNKEIPTDIIEYCAIINKNNKFDMMAYDILFNGNKFLIVEMSYGYVDQAVYNANGYYVLNKKGKIQKFVKGNYWPQELWLDSIISNNNINFKERSGKS